jgi:hypothetical protein
MNTLSNEDMTGLNTSGFMLLVIAGLYAMVLFLLKTYFGGSRIGLRFLAAIEALGAAWWALPYILKLFPFLNNQDGKQFVFMALTGGFVAIAHQMINTPSKSKSGGGI